MARVVEEVELISDTVNKNKVEIVDLEWMRVDHGWGGMAVASKQEVNRILSGQWIVVSVYDFEETGVVSLQKRLGYRLERQMRDRNASIHYK